MKRALLFTILALFLSAAAAPTANAAAIGIFYGAPGASYSPVCQKFVKAFDKEMLKHSRDRSVSISTDYTFLLLEIKNPGEWFIGLFMDFPFKQPEYPGKPLEPFWRVEVETLGSGKVVSQKAEEAVGKLLSYVREQERKKWTI